MKHILFSSRNSPSVIQRREVRNSTCVSTAKLQFRQGGSGVHESLKQRTSPNSATEGNTVAGVPFLPAKEAEREAQHLAGSCCACPAASLTRPGAVVPSRWWINTGKPASSRVPPAEKSSFAPWGLTPWACISEAPILV